MTQVRCWEEHELTLIGNPRLVASTRSRHGLLRCFDAMYG